jgi:uncharacterized membrane protein
MSAMTAIIELIEKFLASLPFRVRAFIFISSTLGLITALGFLFATTPPEVRQRLIADAPKIALAFIGVAGALLVLGAFRGVIAGLQRESKDYARKISRREETSSISASIGPLTVTGRAGVGRLRSAVNQLRAELEAIKGTPIPLDTSTPEKIFQVSRQRLLDEAVRIDSISRRNLIIGILFSVIALGVLAWPLIAAAFQNVDPSQRLDVFAWAAQYYLPRFAVGLLLQFVGFFFLRLYVSNELDLKHNKNEITNLEFKMVGVQLAQAFGDAASKKEIMKSLAATERNFLIRKNEKSISTEASSEHNDLKSVVDRLLDKFPGKQKP